MTATTIEIFEQMVDSMTKIEKDYHEAVKTIDDLDLRQSDLLHSLELDLDNKELKAVNEAIRELRKERREMKDNLINLIIAKEFIVSNYKFLAECSELIKKLKRMDEKIGHRKYYLRDREAMASIISLEKHSDKIQAFVEGA